MVEIVDLPTAGGFFRPEDLSGAHAILIEVTSLERQRPGGNFGPKDTIHANLTVFNTADDLESGNGVEQNGVMIQQTVLVRDLTPLVGKATVVTVGKGVSSKPGQNAPWVFHRVGADVVGKVSAYVQKREAAFEQAKAAMPSFLS